MASLNTFEIAHIHNLTDSDDDSTSSYSSTETSAMSWRHVENNLSSISNVRRVFGTVAPSSSLNIEPVYDLNFWNLKISEFNALADGTFKSLGPSIDENDIRFPRFMIVYPKHFIPENIYSLGFAHYLRNTRPLRYSEFNNTPDYLRIWNMFKRSFPENQYFVHQCPHISEFSDQLSYETALQAVTKLQKEETLLPRFNACRSAVSNAIKDSIELDSHLEGTAHLESLIRRTLQPLFSYVDNSPLAHYSTPTHASLAEIYEASSALTTYRLSRMPGYIHEASGLSRDISRDSFETSLNNINELESDTSSEYSSASEFIDSQEYFITDVHETEVAPTPTVALSSKCSPQSWLADMKRLQRRGFEPFFSTRTFDIDADRPFVYGDPISIETIDEMLEVRVRDEPLESSPYFEYWSLSRRNKYRALVTAIRRALDRDTFLLSDTLKSQILHFKNLILTQRGDENIVHLRFFLDKGICVNFVIPSHLKVILGAMVTHLVPEESCEEIFTPSEVQKLVEAALLNTQLPQAQILDFMGGVSTHHVDAAMGTLLAQVTAILQSSGLNLTSVQRGVSLVCKLYIACNVNISFSVLTAFVVDILLLFDFQLPDLTGFLNALMGLVPSWIRTSQPVAQVSGTDITWFGSIIFSLISLISLRQLPGRHDAAEFITRLGSAGRAVDGSKKIWDFISSALRSTQDVLCQKLLGHAPQHIQEMNDVVENLDQWYTESLDLLQYDARLQIRHDPALCRRVEAAYLAGLRHSRKIFKSDIPREVSLAFRTHFDALSRLFAEVDRTGFVSGGGPRTEPIVILLHGDSGVGKSGAMYPIAIDALKNISAEEAKNWSDNIYMRNPEQEYWDGYRNQPVVIYDEFAQKKDSVNNPNPELFELIRMGNISQLPLHMASVEEKNKTNFTSRVVILTSNECSPPVASLSCPEALLRRIDLCVKVRNVPSVISQVNVGGSALKDRLDPAKVLSVFGHAFSTEVYLFDIMDINTQTVLQTDLSYADLRTKITALYSNRFRSNENLNAYLSRLAEAQVNDRDESSRREDLAYQFWQDLVIEMDNLADPDSDDAQDFSLYTLDENDRYYGRLVGLRRDRYIECEIAVQERILAGSSEEEIRTWLHQAWYGALYFYSNDVPAEDGDGQLIFIPGAGNRSFRTVLRSWYNSLSNMFASHPILVAIGSAILVTSILVKFGISEKIAVGLGKLFGFKVSCSAKRYVLTNFRCRNNPLSSKITGIKWCSRCDFCKIVRSLKVHTNKFSNEDVAMLFLEDWRVLEMEPDDFMMDILRNIDDHPVEINGFFFKSHEILKMPLTVQTEVSGDSVTKQTTVRAEAEPEVSGDVKTQAVHARAEGWFSKLFPRKEELLEETPEAEAWYHRFIGDNVKETPVVIPDAEAWFDIFRKKKEELDLVDDLEPQAEFSDTFNHLMDLMRRKKPAPTLLDDGDNVKILDYRCGEISSGDSTTRNSLPRVEIDRSGVPHCEAVIDQNAYDLISNKVFSNMYRLYTVSNLGNEKERLNITFIRGRVALTVNHTVEILKQAESVILRNAFNPAGLSFSTSDLKFIPLVTNSGYEKDAMLIEFPRQCPCFPDLLDHFVTPVEMKIKSVRANLVGMRITGGMKTIAPVLNCILEAEARDTTLDYALTSGPDQRTITVREHYAYATETVPGDCGAMLIASNTSLQRKILGIHVCAVSGFGYSTSITRADLELTLKLAPPVTQVVLCLDELISDTMCDMPSGDFIPIGKHRASYMSPMNTTLAPSMIHGDVTQPTTAPSALRPITFEGKRIDPMQNGLKKAGIPSKIVDKQLLADAVSSYKPKILAKIDQKFKRVLTDDEAVAGVDGEMFLAAINRRSSAGFGWVKRRKFNSIGKSQWLGEFEEFKLDAEVVERMRLYEENALLNKRQPTIWIDTLKDERRPLEKVLCGKTRVFSAGQMDYILIVRKYFLGFLAHVMTNRIDNEIAVGINPFGPDWCRLAIHLQSKGASVIAGDFSNFDGSLIADFLWATYDIIHDFYDDPQIENNDRYHQIRRILWEEIVNSVHICNNNIYMWTHSQPSGNPLTAVVNSIVNNLMIRVVFMKIVKRKDLPMTMRDFNRYVERIAYGDDDVSNISLEIVDWFNQETITEAYSELGMTYTDEAKTGIVVPTRLLSDISFLKRQFVFDPVQRRWLAPLELKVVLEIPNWIRGPLNPVQATIENVETAVSELGLHSEEIFNTYAPQFSKACCFRTKRLPELYSWQFYRDRELERTFF